MVQGGVETEVKIRISDLSRTLERLQAAGFTVAVPRIFEANTLYDRPDGSLRQSGMLLRLREAGTKSVITWKGVQQTGPYKARPELETIIGSATTMHQILVSLGFVSTFRYEKYRTEFHQGNRNGVVTVDETPVGDFLELEGAGEWIDETAAILGFSENNYILDSYGTLYLKYCEEHAIAPANMVFSS